MTQYAATQGEPRMFVKSVHGIRYQVKDVARAIVVQIGDEDIAVDDLVAAKQIISLGLEPGAKCFGCLRGVGLNDFVDAL